MLFSFVTADLNSRTRASDEVQWSGAKSEMVGGKSRGSLSLLKNGDVRGQLRSSAFPVGWRDCPQPDAQRLPSAVVWALVY